MSIKRLLCNCVASFFASRCCWSSGIRSLLVAISLMFGEDESIISGVVPRVFVVLEIFCWLQLMVTEFLVFAFVALLQGLFLVWP